MTYLAPAEFNSLIGMLWYGYSTNAIKWTRVSKISAMIQKHRPFPHIGPLIEAVLKDYKETSEYINYVTSHAMDLFIKKDGVVPGAWLPDGEKLHLSVGQMDQPYWLEYNMPTDIDCKNLSIDQRIVELRNFIQKIGIIVLSTSLSDTDKMFLRNRRYQSMWANAPNDYKLVSHMLHCIGVLFCNENAVVVPGFIYTFYLDENGRALYPFDHTIVQGIYPGYLDMNAATRHERTLNQYTFMMQPFLKQLHRQACDNLNTEQQIWDIFSGK